MSVNILKLPYDLFKTFNQHDKLNDDGYSDNIEKIMNLNGYDINNSDINNSDIDISCCYSISSRDIYTSEPFILDGKLLHFIFLIMLLIISLILPLKYSI